MKPHRADRRWATAWSPQQISNRIRVDFPDDESMRISHEAIYQALFIQGRGALKRELVACLRTGRALREPRARTRNKPQGHISADVVLSQRPADAADRAVPGHWEGDLIIGTGRSAIGTLVERSSRSTLLVHLPRMDGWRERPTVKNGPSLGGYGALAMNAALTASMTRLPEQLRATLTWDRGKELSGHAQFALDTGTKPHSLRHGFATEALAIGIPLQDVQDALRHRDPRTTRRYGRTRHNLDCSPPTHWPSHSAGSSHRRPRPTPPTHRLTSVRVTPSGASLLFVTGEALACTHDAAVLPSDSPCPLPCPGWAGRAAPGQEVRGVLWPGGAGARCRGSSPARRARGSGIGRDPWLGHWAR
ncbi:hypothetical protein FB380_004848 [Modestobacter marinus]|nr:hypothetical protein [Modestobacter marinus]NIH70337.1 hypothetical protein [Modestobacter marinus]